MASDKSMKVTYRKHFETNQEVFDYVFGDIEFIEYEGNVCAKYLNTSGSTKIIPIEKVVRIELE